MPTTIHTRGRTFIGCTNYQDYQIHANEKNVKTEPTPMWYDSSSLSKFNAAHFCRLLGSHQLLLIGDSVVDQLSVTLMNSIFPLDCETQLIFGHSNTLVGKKFGHGENQGLTWWKNIEHRDSPELVFIGTGNHLVGLSIEEYGKYWENLMKDMDD
jgi:hypothetical protein